MEGSGDMRLGRLWRSRASKGSVGWKWRLSRYAMGIFPLMRSVYCWSSCDDEQEVVVAVEEAAGVTDNDIEKWRRKNGGEGVAFMDYEKKNK